MDIKSRRNVEPVGMHQTLKVHCLVPKFSMFEATQNSYLELIDDFEVPAGEACEPHYHNTHEYYFILEGNAVVQIEQEAKRVQPGDLIHIPPNQIHSIWPTGDKGVRAVAIAVGWQEPKGIGHIPAPLPRVPVTD
jgi:quercetin dioxygenase-like cupin family protein